MKKVLSLLVLLSVNVASAAEPAVDPWEKRLNADGLLELEWDDLVPADFDPNKLFMQIARKYDITELDDSDPRAKQIQAEVQQVWDHAPAVPALNSRRVKLPGLVVPLEGDGKTMSEFLLVPYYGACIHVPPPPSNQIVYVRVAADKAVLHEMFEAVWVTGKLLVQHNSSDIGQASYTLDADKVELYE